MSTTAIAVIVVLAVLFVAAVIVLVALVNKMLQRKQLRQRFGPEYDRAVGAAGSQKEAELDLRDRLERRNRVTVQPLAADERERYTQEWRQIQAAFVDAPIMALGQADSLITKVMVRRGYPMQDFEGQADLVSVDYPGAVEKYRHAHGIYADSQAASAATEDVRRAFVSYRSLFAQLVESDEAAQVVGMAPVGAPAAGQRQEGSSTTGAP